MTDKVTISREMLPCPFCGSHAQSGNGFHPCESITYVWCSNHLCELHLIDNCGFTPETWNTRAALAAPAQDADTVAMQTAAKIMELVYGPMPIGGSVQLRAQVQCLVHDAIGQSPAQDGWIPVSERLPSVAQEVIVSSEFEGVCAGVLDSYGEWYAPCSEYKLIRITHWTPLPPPPKEIK